MCANKYLCECREQVTDIALAAVTTLQQKDLKRSICGSSESSAHSLFDN